MLCTNETSGCSPNVNFSWQSAICSFPYFPRVLIYPFAFALFWRESLPRFRVTVSAISSAKYFHTRSASARL